MFRYKTVPFVVVAVFLMHFIQWMFSVPHYIVKLEDDETSLVSPMTPVSVPPVALLKLEHRQAHTKKKGILWSSVGRAICRPRPLRVSWSSKVCAASHWMLGMWRMTQHSGQSGHPSRPLQPSAVCRLLPLLLRLRQTEGSSGNMTDRLSAQRSNQSPEKLWTNTQLVELQRMLGVIIADRTTSGCYCRSDGWTSPCVTLKAPWVQTRLRWLWWFCSPD